MDEDKGLVYIGKVIQIDEIKGADYIVCATVVCGRGGKWQGIVKKHDFECGSLCVVYLPDSIIPPCKSMDFMQATNWRVKMRRFRGAPSEVVIMPYASIIRNNVQFDFCIGFDLTELVGVKKYYKPIPANLASNAKGNFPVFIPKTDEDNYQRIPEVVGTLQGHPYYVTEKADGSSTTAYKYKGQFGLCSRNWELQFKENNGFWQIAQKYDVENKLPEGYAIQWETCGPGIQSNPMGLKEISGFAFSVYNIVEQRYLNMHEFISFCNDIKFPTVKILEKNAIFDKLCLTTIADRQYPNGMPAEGVVIRSINNLLVHKPISFKVINLNYKD